MTNTEYGTSKNEKIYGKVIWEGEVIDVLDGEENGVIKVRIPELDKTVPDERLPFCYPLFNFSFFRALPKKGERVTLMFRNVYNTTDSDSKDIRYWVSIVHSNVYNLEYQPFLIESNSHYVDSVSKSPSKTSTIVESKGIFPKAADISISSRNNCTIFLRNSEMLLRVGGHEENSNLKFNKKNPAYQFLKYPNKKNNITKKRIVSNQTFIPPKNQIVVQYNTDTKANIQIKDKKTGQVLSTSVYTKDTKAELTVNLKSEILKFQNQFPYWELLTFDETLNNLPKIYSTDNGTETSEEDIVEEKSLTFSLSATVADKIFLIGHLNNEFNLKKQPDLFTDDDLINLSESAHPIPYGDRLIEFLDLMRQVMVNHVHPYHAMKCVPEEIVLKMLNFDLTKLLNKNVFTG